MAWSHLATYWHLFCAYVVPTANIRSVYPLYSWKMESSFSDSEQLALTHRRDKRPSQKPKQSYPVRSALPLGSFLSGKVSLMLITPTPGPHGIRSDDWRDSEEAVSLPLAVKDRTGHLGSALGAAMGWGPNPQLPAALLLPVPVKNTSQHAACKPGPSCLLPQLAGETKIKP